MATMEQIVKQLAERAQKEDAERFKKDVVDTLIKVQTAAFTSAMAYTNLIIVGGYAAFFTIWSFMKDKLPETAMVWAALLMTISAILFVSFETYKMIINGRMIFALGRIQKVPPEQFKEGLAEWERDQQRLVATHAKVWAVTLILVVGTGHSGVCILVYQFVSKLLGR